MFDFPEKVNRCKIAPRALQALRTSTLYSIMLTMHFVIFHEFILTLCMEIFILLTRRIFFTRFDVGESQNWDCQHIMEKCTCIIAHACICPNTSIRRYHLQMLLQTGAVVKWHIMHVHVKMAIVLFRLYYLYTCTNAVFVSVSVFVYVLVPGLLPNLAVCIVCIQISSYDPKVCFDWILKFIGVLEVKRVQL